MSTVIYLTISVCIAALLSLGRTHRAVACIAAIFYAMQAACAAVCLLMPPAPSAFFAADPMATLFFVLLAAVSPVAFAHVQYYVGGGSLRQVRLFNQLLILLCAAITGVYFASNIAVTWICLEATTLCAAGVIYHRRGEDSLEATWKYIFVCSTGIAIAYLGILLLCGTSGGQDLSYSALSRAVTHGNPLYLKIAFLLILTGYSCKLEVFPLYPIGVDANYAAPAPAAALISTALVNAGLVSLLRLYKALQFSEIFPWVRSVLLFTGLVTLLFGAVFLRRAAHLKRFLSYSTVENMGLVLLGLGAGGAGVAAALMHAVAHTLVKSSMFLLAAQAGKTFDSYRTADMRDYIHTAPSAAAALITGALMLMAFPPSLLFVSEIGILGATAAAGKWWIVGAAALLLCVAVYGICNTVFKICYRSAEAAAVSRPSPPRAAFTWSAVALLAAAMVLGVWRPPFFTEMILSIANF